MKTPEINNFLIQRFKDAFLFDHVEVFHYRALVDTYYSYKEIRKMKEKEFSKSMTDNLDRGFTVVLLKNSEDPTSAIAAISICNELDNFNKSQGLNLCLKRLDNYLSKPEKDFESNPNNYFQLTNVPLAQDELIDVVSAYLMKNHPHFKKEGNEIFIPKK